MRSVRDSSAAVTGAIDQLATISELIAAIQQETDKAVGVAQDGAQRTEQGAAVVEQTREAFQRIGLAVDDVTARVQEIAASSQQIGASATSMQDKVDEIASVAENELATNADRLNQLIGQFKTAA
jgi:methyl-accepting chemotaxis protein